MVRASWRRWWLLGAIATLALSGCAGGGGSSDQMADAPGAGAEPPAASPSATTAVPATGGDVAAPDDVSLVGCGARKFGEVVAGFEVSNPTVEVQDYTIGVVFENADTGERIDQGSTTIDRVVAGGSRSAEATGFRSGWGPSRRGHVECTIGSVVRTPS